MIILVVFNTVLLLALCAASYFLVKRKSIYTCIHSWGEPSGSYQACKTCNMQMLVPKPECSHEWKEINNEGAVNSISKINLYTTYVLKCEECGDMKQKTIFYGKE
jgi:hypothetical protein